MVLFDKPFVAPCGVLVQVQYLQHLRKSLRIQCQ